MLTHPAGGRVNFVSTEKKDRLFNYFKLIIMMKEVKDLYVSPCIKVMELFLEEIIAASGDVPVSPGGEWPIENV